MRRGLALCLLFLCVGVDPSAAQEWRWLDSAWFDVPPLDSAVMWARQTGPNACHGCTADVLSLVMDVSTAGEPAAHPWPLFVQLTTDQSGGDAVGITSRLYSRQPLGWATAYHAEPYNLGHATVIGLNVEPHSGGLSGRTLGAVFNAVEGSSEAAILITADGGSWDKGIDLGGTSIDLGGGRVLKLDRTGRLCAWKRTGKKDRCLTGPL